MFNVGIYDCTYVLNDMFNKIKHYLALACHIWLTTVHFILLPWP